MKEWVGGKDWGISWLRRDLRPMDTMPTIAGSVQSLQVTGTRVQATFREKHALAPPGYRSRR